MLRKKCKMSEHHLYLLLTKSVTDPKQNEFLKELKFASKTQENIWQCSNKNIDICVAGLTPRYLN
jgi:hypothetical protein